MSDRRSESSGVQYIEVTFASEGEDDYGLWFPAGTPMEFVNRIQSEVAKAVHDPVTRQRLEEQGLEAVGSTPQELAKAIAGEFAVNKKITTSIGIVPQ